MAVNNTINSFTEVQEALLSVLNNNAAFDKCGVKILAEDSKELEFEIKEAIGKQGIVATVTTPRVSYSGQYARNTGITNPQTLPYWTIDEINVIVAEQPTINRARATEKEIIVRDEYVFTGGGTSFRPDIVGNTFQMIVQTKQAFIDITTLKREGTFFANGSSEYGPGDFSLNCRTSDNKEFTVEINNPSFAGIFSRVELSESFVEGEDYEIIDDNFYVFKKPVFVYGSTMRETGDKINLSTVEHQVEKETVYTYAMTAMDAALQAANTLVELNSVVPIDISQTVEDGLVFATVRLKSNIIFLYNKTYITN